ncbi:MAG: GspE/PulE family protein [Phycisphaerales bacterium JB037]
MLDSSHFLVRTLHESGELNDQELRAAGEHASLHGCTVLESLLSLGTVTSRQLAIARAKICEYPFVDLAAFQVDIKNANLLPRSVAERTESFPLFSIDGVTTVGMVDPLNLQAFDQIRQIIRTEVEPVLCDPEQLRALSSRAYSLIRSGEDAGSKKSDQAESLTTGDEPVVAAVNQILASAVESGASDIHLNPDERELHVRFRIDGVLHTQQGPPHSMHAGLMQRLKVMSHLDLTQSRRPQDGKFRFGYPGGYVDVRLSLLPTIHGENAVMRLLRPASAIGKIEDLGLPTDQERWFRDAVAKPHGMILVTGPTGSGKTTTLYTALHHINAPERNIMTIEDPVELRLPLIRQVQANHEIGMGFASALRSILRQDPDVVLVGEIRDEETARIATQAAMTGHLVLSTLHTNDAVGAVARLNDLGVPHFAINAALLSVIAQRLVRRLCSECAAPGEATDDQAQALGLPEHDRRGFLEPKGCHTCHGIGFSGRLGVYETLVMNARIRRMVDAGATTSELREAAAAEGMRELWHDGLEKARRGLTALSEIIGLRASLEERASPQEPTRAAA